VSDTWKAPDSFKKVADRMTHYILDNRGDAFRLSVAAAQGVRDLAILLRDAEAENQREMYPWAEKSNEIK
jgi:hypothetical protein